MRWAAAAMSLALAPSATATEVAVSEESNTVHVESGEAVPEVQGFILDLSPKLRVDRAEELATIIVAVADEYDLDPFLLAAIIDLESDFRRGIIARHQLQKRDGTIYYRHDYGVAQINWETWGRKWRLDPHRLQHDDAYCIRVAARILAGVRDRWGDEPDWWTRYHSHMDRHRARYKRILLPKLPERYRAEIVGPSAG